MSNLRAVIDFEDDQRNQKGVVALYYFDKDKNIAIPFSQAFKIYTNESLQTVEDYND